ncbi:redox-regulated ATPase YchF [Candidatus Woesearchaeota archaeon]|nr:redox-regulated ATPase YchF [Candidatus Woesearchaeota archaeon]
MIIGIVGKANVGKSTFFKAMTLADIEIANYPFATIKPNHGIGFVRIECVDTFFKVQCNPREGFCINHQRFVPVNVIDVAGLVPGAHEGKGMGNQFLDDLRQADALIHVIDCAGATNENGEPMQPGTYDPAKDILFLEEELDYWYRGILVKGWEKFARTIQMEHQEVEKPLAKQLSGLGVNENHVKDAIKKLNLDPEKPISWTEEQLFEMAKILRKMTKPMVIAANKIDIAIAKENYERLKKEFPDRIIVPCSADSELALKSAESKGLIVYLPGDNHFEIAESGKLNDAQKKAFEYINENVLERFGSSGVQICVNKAVLELLKYMAIYPGGLNNLVDKDGNVLPDCFLMPENSTALDFAFKLHTDLGEKFIRAIDVKKKQTVGKDYPLHHLDVIEIVADK